MQDEATYTGTSLIQYRESIRLLHLKAESRSQTHVYLDGPAGCGKSIALVSLVDWARSQGWLVSTGIFLVFAILDYLHLHFGRNANVLEIAVHAALECKRCSSYVHKAMGMYAMLLPFLQLL